MAERFLMCSASADGGVRLTQKARNAGVTLEPIAAASEIIKIWSLDDFLVPPNLAR